MNYIHITGFSRCGTTLLKNLFVCFRNTFITPGEISRVGFVSPPGSHGKVIVTKNPKDVEEMDQLMVQPSTKVLFSIRDPRDRVCSIPVDGEGKGRDPGIISTVDDSEYYQTRFLFLERFGNQVLVIKYEDIIQRPEETQQEIADHCGLEVEIPFAQGWVHFSKQERENQLKNVMNGLRPLDDRAIGRWKTGLFRAAVQEYVSKNPPVQRFIDEYYPS